MSLDANDLEIARALRAALAGLNRRLRTRDEPTGIGPTGFSLLARLWRGGPASAAALAASERLQPQSLTRSLNALETRDLIARTADDTDRRRITITITRAGAVLLRNSVRRRESWLAHALADALSETERDVLRIAIPLLERLADAD